MIEILLSYDNNMIVAILQVICGVSCVATAMSSQVETNPKWEWYKPHGDASPEPSAEIRKGADIAIGPCYEFYNLIGLPPQERTPTVSAISPRLLSICFAPRCYFTYDIDDRYICHYREIERPLLFYERAKQKVPFKYPSTAKALVRIKQLAKSLGVPSNYSVIEAGRFDKRRPLKGKSGQADAVFQLMPYGYRFESGVNTYRIRIDPTDGLLLEYEHFKSPPYVIESHTPKLRLSEAKAIASRLPGKYRLGLVESYEKQYASLLAPAEPSCLRYVFPNGRFDGVKYSGKQIPHRYRLAWVVAYPRGDKVFVDAADGRILGGVTHLDRDRKKIHG